MNAKNQAHAPYNFVPFHTKSNSSSGQKTERVCIRYENSEQLPPHDTIDPELKTGEIHVKMTAETPVFVSGGEGGSFYHGANGRLMIPGSTVRGMLRQNVQILGYGTVRPDEDIEDQRIFFRTIAARRDGTDGDLNSYYKSVLGMPAGRPAPGSDHVPQNVSAGYLCCEAGGYRIWPTCAPVIRVRRDDPVLRQAHLNDGYAKVEPVSYALQGNRVQSIARAAEGNGELLYTGKPVNTGKGAGAVYLFPAADRDASPLELSEKDIISYRADLESRANSLKAYYSVSFWELPKPGKSIPVFYVQHNGHTYFGMTSHPRIGYAHSLSDGLPEPDKHMEEGLDYPHAMFGFAGKEHAYRSRVSVGDFPAQDGAEEGGPISLILGQPKPSWYPGYITDGEHYNEDGFSLRGFKLYWQKDAALPPVEEGKDSVKTVMRPLTAGTIFRGIIRYKNLHPDELGLLLWALRLEDGCRQSLGMAKPYGFGRMRLEIEKLLEYDIQKLYTVGGLCAGPEQAPDGAVERYIHQFDTFICEQLRVKKPSAIKPSITSQGDIQDFFFMHKPLQADEDTSYVELPAYKKLDLPLPSVRNIREAAERAASQSENTAPDPDDWEAMLKKRFATL